MSICSTRSFGFLLAAAAAEPSLAHAQRFPTENPVIRRLWDEGMTAKSQAARLIQVLSDSIGPRLTASPGHDAATDWLMARYQEWGIPARKEKYGTWRGWRRGYSHVDLVAPRVRSLEGLILAWSPGTKSAVEGSAVLLPDLPDSAAFDAWLPSVKGKFVLTRLAEPTCRPDENWERLARPASVIRMKAERDTARAAWNRRIARLAGASGQGVPQPAGRVTKRLEQAGAAGIITNGWSNGWGVDKIFSASTERVPTVQLSCEDYGLVYRLAENNQGPRLRVDARSEELGERPVFNVVGEIKGSEKPNEYVVLSAHLDSWDGSSGTTDNGTGTVTMLEAMRLLKIAYPNPKRTIIVGHWGGEEQGLVGSRSFAEDHPEVISGLQAAFNQDNGTWRVEYIRMMGLTGAGAHFGRWLSQIPGDIENLIDLDIPGEPEAGGSDHMAFLCYPAPAFRLQSHYPDYRQYTWHTNRDTYDKVIIDDLKNNATLAAMLVYMASEDPEKVPRDKRILADSTGRVRPWPACGKPPRSSPPR